MKSNRRLYIVLAVAGACIFVLWLSTSFGQTRRKYEVETQVYGVPEYRSDAARAVDAYERLMDRYMDLTERNLFSVSADVRTITAQLDAVHAEVAGVNARLARIEKHLGIQSPVPPAPAEISAPRVPATPGNVPPALAPVR
ncbi:MAG: hypothetical protein JW741_31070 [Sedimentisphaerales bacterium]|nr:hypothetical protein [Sedimentisphaerales bacterium]